jgi:hypothetical protein
VKDSKYVRVQEDPAGIAYFPVSQEQGSPSYRSFVLRTRGTFGGAMAGAKRHVEELHGGRLVEFRVMEQDLERSIARNRLMAMLSGGFGVLEALLSALGLYGVMSYMVARRRGEIGVRLALGARRSHVSTLMMGEAARLLLLGLLLGLGASLALWRYAEAFTSCSSTTTAPPPSHLNPTPASTSRSTKSPSASVESRDHLRRHAAHPWHFRAHHHRRRRDSRPGAPLLQAGRRGEDRRLVVLAH